jgi:hypothetical protein
MHGDGVSLALASLLMIAKGESRFSLWQVIDVATLN